MNVILMYFSLGALVGIIAGTLGIGGGLIIVPALIWIFQYQNFPTTVQMHLAIGTSLAVLLVTTLRAILAHRKHRIEFWNIFKPLLPGVIVGVLGGSFLGRYMHSRVIAIVFGIVVIIIAVPMLFTAQINPKRHLPGSFGMGCAGLSIGVLSGLLGLAGGTFSISFLTYCNVPMRQSILVSIAIAFTISIFGTLSMILTGLSDTGLPPLSTGYVYWPAWLCLVVGSLLFVPMGVAISYRLPVHILKKCLAFVLILIGMRMLSVG